MEIIMNDDEQWGNISLPGVSDEELFKKNWSRSATMKELHKNPEYKKKLINEKSKKKISKALKEFHADPANKDKLEQAQQKRYASMDWEKHREHNARINSDPEIRKKSRETLRKKYQDPEFVEKVVKPAREKMKNNPEWRKANVEHNARINSDPEIVAKKLANHKQWQQSEEGRHAFLEGRKKVCSPVQDENGMTYSSVKEAGQIRFPHPTRSDYGPRKVQKLLKDPNSGWKKLSK